MTWGSAFRSAWEHGTTAGRTAAREAAQSPDKAASLLSDAIVHTLQRALYAAQDVQRIQGTSAPQVETEAPGAAALRRVMDDIRQGRIAPERSEKHLQQAARTAAEQVASQRPIPDDAVVRRNEVRMASQRFQEMRRRLIAQMMAQSSQSDCGGPLAGELHNVELGAHLSQSFAKIDQLFLENKPVDDPAVPLPPQTRSTEGKTGVSCLQPRA